MKPVPWVGEDDLSRKTVLALSNTFRGDPARGAITLTHDKEFRLRNSD